MEMEGVERASWQQKAAGRFQGSLDRPIRIHTPVAWVNSKGVDKAKEQVEQMPPKKRVKRNIKKYKKKKVWTIKQCTAEWKGYDFPRSDGSRRGERKRDPKKETCGYGRDEVGFGCWLLVRGMVAWGLTAGKRRRPGVGEFGDRGGCGFW